MRLISNFGAEGVGLDLAAFYLADETALVDRLIGQTGLSQPERADITRRAIAMAQNLREQTGSIGFVDALMQEYGLSSADGIALMRLAEALIRTPDHTTASQLVRDKFIGRSWASMQATARLSWSIWLRGGCSLPRYGCNGPAGQRPALCWLVWAIGYFWPP